MAATPRDILQGTLDLLVLRTVSLEEKLAAAWKFAREIGSGAILIVQRGVIVAAWGDINKPTTYSRFVSRCCTR